MKAGSKMHLPKESTSSENSFDIDIETLLGGFAANDGGLHVSSSKLLCHDCQQMGRESTLQLYQINFEEAVYLCPSPFCVYPMREENFVNSFIIKRDASLLATESHQTSTPNGTKPRKARKDKKASSYSDFFHEFDAATLLSDLTQSTNKDVTQSVSNQAENPNHVADEGVWPDTTGDASLAEAPQRDDQSMDVVEHEINGEAKYLPAGDEKRQSDVNDSAASVETKKSGDTRMVGLDEPCEKPISVVEDVCMVDDCSLDVTTAHQRQALSALVDSSDVDSCIMDDLERPPTKQSIVQWMNKANSCWLDCILMCLTNSVNVRAILNHTGTGENHVLKKVCLLYDRCQKKYHENCGTAGEQSDATLLCIKEKLEATREEVLGLLQNRLHIDSGVFQSLSEMFPLVLKTNESVEQSFKVRLLWEFKCDVCGHRRARRSTAHIVSFPYTSADFHPLNAYFERQCFKCKEAKGHMTMLMEKLPPCLIFHFQKGLRSSNFRVLDFGLQGCLYSVFAVVQYIVSPAQHFVTWVRDTKTNQWLCADDLKDPVCRWQTRQPKLPPEEVHMVLWERLSVTDPKNFEESHVSTVVNEEAASIANEIPVELFYAHELDEAIVLSEDNVLHKFNSVEKLARVDTSPQSQECRGTRSPPQVLDSVGPCAKPGSSDMQNNFTLQSDSFGFNDASAGQPEQVPATPNHHDMTQLTARGISVFPDLNGTQTIQIVAPENTCNIIIMTGGRQQNVVYSANRPVGTYGHESSTPHSFLEKIHPYRKSSRRASASPGLGSETDFHPYKPKCRFRLSGYSSTHHKKSQFSPLKMSHSSGNATVTDSAIDRSDSEKWSEISELSDLFPESDLSSRSSLSSGHSTLKGVAITPTQSAANSRAVTPAMSLEPPE